MKFLEIAELDVLSRALNLSTPTLRVTTRIEAYSCKAINKEKKLFKTLEAELMQDLSHSTSISPPEQHQGLLDSAFGPLDKRASRKTLWLLIGLLNVAFPDHDFSKVRPEEFRREEGPRAVLASLSAALENVRAPPSQRSFALYPPSSSMTFSGSPTSDPVSLPATEGDALATNPFLRSILDPVIELSECEVFTYSPEVDSDPYAADTDDESDVDTDGDAFERDDEGLAWEMDDVDVRPSSRSMFSHSGPSWTGGYGTPKGKKAFSSFAPPGTPTTDTDEWVSPRRSSALLWSSFIFFYNKRMKRILFISTRAVSVHPTNMLLARSSGHHLTNLKRSASTHSNSSVVAPPKRAKASA